MVRVLSPAEHHLMVIDDSSENIPLNSKFYALPHSHLYMHDLSQPPSRAYTHSHAPQSRAAVHRRIQDPGKVL